MLYVDLRALSAGPIETERTLAADDPILADVDFTLSAPVRVAGRLTESGPGEMYWHGTLRTRVAATCRRCLTSVPVELAVDVRVLFTEDAGTDDPDAYVMPPDVTQLDLAPMIREELILAVPDYVLCREDCQGLCAQCGQDLNVARCDCRPAPDPRWGALEALRAQLAEQERD